MPGDGCAPLDVLPLEAPGRAVRARDAAAAGASAPADAQPALGHGRAEDRRLRARASRSRSAADRVRLARPEWGGLVVSPNGVYKTLVRHGLNTRAKRLALVAGHRASFQPSRESEPEPHIQTTRPGELVGVDCFFVGRLHGSRGPVWQITAIDTYSSFAWADLVTCPPSGPTVKHTSALARRVAAELQHAGWRLERVLTDNGNEFGRREFAAQLPAGDAPHADPLRAPPNQRARRTTAPHDPRGVLAARVRPLPASPLQRPAPRSGPLPARLQLRPRALRTNHGRAMPGRTRQSGRRL